MLNFDTLITYIEGLGDRVKNRTVGNAALFDGKTYQVIIDGISKISLGLNVLANNPPSTEASAIAGVADNEMLTAEHAVAAITAWLTDAIPLTGYGLIEVKDTASVISLTVKPLATALRFSLTAQETDEFKAASTDPVFDVATNTLWEYSVDTWYSTANAHLTLSTNSFYFSADPVRFYVRGATGVVKLSNNYDYAKVLTLNDLNAFPSVFYDFESIDVMHNIDYSSSMYLLALATADYLGSFE